MAHPSPRVRLGSTADDHLHSDNPTGIAASSTGTSTGTRTIMSVSLSNNIDDSKNNPSPTHQRNASSSTAAAAAAITTITGSLSAITSTNGNNGKVISPLIKSDAVRREEKAEQMRKRSKESLLKKHSSKIENTCLICMGPFSKKRPPMNIPCKNICNKTPVHAKCIYEWSCTRLASEETPNCPLCRGEMDKIEYTPPSFIPSFDALTSSEETKRNFITRPLPRAAGIIRCYIRVHHVGSVTNDRIYELYLQGPTGRPYPDGLLPDIEYPDDDDVLLLSARNCGYTFGSTSMRVITENRHGNYNLDSPSLVALIQGSFLGLEYTMKYPNGNEIVGIAYNQNRFGKAVGPRKVKVCFPKIVEDNSSKKASTNDNSNNISPNHILVASRDGRDDGGIGERIGNASGAPTRTKSKDSIYEGSVASVHSLIDDENRSVHATPKLGISIASGADYSAVNKAGRDDVVEYLEDIEEEIGSRSNNNNNEAGENDNDEDDDDEMLDPDETVWVTWDYKPTKANLPLSKYASKGIQAIRTSKLKHYFAFNREPVWLEDVGVFSLDFHGRVTLPSNKNFQMLVHGIDTSDDLFHLQFGKVADEEFKTVYTMDLQWPFSILQAFGICVSACDPKIACA